MRKDVFHKRMLEVITTHLDFSGESLEGLRQAASDALTLSERHGDDIPDVDAEQLLGSLRHDHA